MSKKAKNENEKKFPKMPMEAGDMRLFPDEFSANAASASECTGLIQVPPEDDEDMEVYDDIYSFRQDEPIVKKEE